MTAAGNGAGATPKRVFGPVPSRRLGRSLGIDPVPYKTCSYDCVYCQLGHTTDHTCSRRAYVSAEELIGELEAWVRADGVADFLTLSGSGEPTLNTGIGEIIAWCKRHTEIPVAVLTNGSLLGVDEVRAGVREADLVIPSLDAATEATRQRVNRPHPDAQSEAALRGMRALRAMMRGEMWVEVMLVADVNDSPQELRALREALDRIQLDRVQLNTVARPPADAAARAVSERGLCRAQAELGPGTEIVAPTTAAGSPGGRTDGLEGRIVELLLRRPCTITDIAWGLGVHLNEVVKQLPGLLASGHIQRTVREGVTHYGRTTARE